MSVQIETDSIAGPASYSTGGFVVTTGLATVNHFKIFVSVPGANLTQGHFEYSRNTPAAGQVTVKFLRHRYTKTPSVDSALASLPAGISESSTSGQVYDAAGNHLHNMDHNHASATSGNNTQIGGGTPLDAVGPQNISVHTHAFDPPNFIGNTGNEDGHTHQWSNIYQHQHPLTNVAFAVAYSELPNGTDLSGSTLLYRATS